jgi:hypothetical protein
MGGAANAGRVVEEPKAKPIPVIPIIRLSGSVGREEDVFRLLRPLRLKVVEERGSSSGGWIWHLESQPGAEIDERVQAVIFMERTPRNSQDGETKLRILVRSKARRGIAVQIGEQVAAKIQEDLEPLGGMAIDTEPE